MSAKGAPRDTIRDGARNPTLLFGKPPGAAETSFASRCSNSSSRQSYGLAPFGT